MVKLKYYGVGIDDVFLNSKIELMMDIVEFTSYIRNNSIDNVFISEYSEKFSGMKNITPRFNDSKIFFAFDCNKNLMLWTDSWGYLSIEDYEESWKNRIFHTINRLKNKYSDWDYWQDSTGYIYESLRLEGYKNDEDVEDSIQFFQGHRFKYKKYREIRDYSKKCHFQNITQTIISSNAAFKDIWDYDDAMEMKAPNMETLSSMRLLKDLRYKLSFKDYTSALLFVVMLKLRRCKINSNEELKTSLEELRMELWKYSPETTYLDFRNVESDEDLEEIIQYKYGFSKIGFYNEYNNEFHFSKLIIFIDVSNVIHNGQRKGGKNANTEKPEIKFLEECIKCLEEQEIKVAGIYMDYTKNNSLRTKYPDQNNKYLELKSKLMREGVSVTETFDGEIADKRLIQKLKDDQSCYVVSNDSYQEFNLTKSQRRRLINFERTSNGKYRFFVQLDENNEIELNKLIEENAEGLDKYENVTSLRNIGNWPYPDKCNYFEISTFLNKHLKDM